MTQQLIRNILYERWKESNEENNEKFWHPVDSTKGHPIICSCGNDTFRILATYDYETTGQCLQCGLTEVVHSG